MTADINCDSCNNIEARFQTRLEITLSKYGGPFEKSVPIYLHGVGGREQFEAN